MKELRNYGDEVAREITSRGGVEGSLSQQRFFEDLMKLVRVNIFIRFSSNIEVTQIKIFYG